MRKTWKIAILSGALLAGIAGSAAADPRVRFSIGFGVPAPVVYEPAYYYPPPRPVYGPPAEVYYAPPVVYPRPVVYGGYGYPYWRHHHRHWR